VLGYWKKSTSDTCVSMEKPEHEIFNGAQFHNSHHVRTPFPAL
jgi:hypothetical protein